MIQIVLDEKSLSYEDFINNLADILATKLSMKKPPKIVCSQREAYRMYGVGNVRRWKKEGRLIPHAKRPGKIEYKITDLKALFNKEQDYFTSDGKI